MNDFNSGFNQEAQQQRHVVNDAPGINAFLSKMYGWISLSIIISAIVAYVAGNVLQLRLSGMANIVLIIAWIIIPFVMQKHAMKNAALGMFELLLFSGLTGLMFSSIFMVYTGTTITSAFISSATIFIVMSFYGMTTKKNLDRIGAQATAALIGVIVAMLVNLFLKSGAISLFLSAALVIIFTILLASDTKKMKNLYNQYNQSIPTTGLAITGALQLYLDFINIFVNLLSIFGMGDNR